MKSPTAGVALISVLILAVVLMVMLGAYTTLTLSEARTARASADSAQGFYAAEAGLNMRAELVRAKFLGYARPTGTSPSAAQPCTGSNQGSGDLRCLTYTLAGRRIVTSVEDTTVYVGGKPTIGTVGPGEVFVGVYYQQYAYRVRSVALNAQTGAPEARLEMVFQSRLLPLFQFAAFYQDDLEMHPGALTTINGRVHTNGSLYLNSNPNVAANAAVEINGRTTTGNSIYRYGKDGRPCTGTVRFFSITLPCNAPEAAPFSGDYLSDRFGKRVLSNQPKLVMPRMNDLAPGNPDSEFWRSADVRIVATQTRARVGTKGQSGYTAPEFNLRVVRVDNSVDWAATLTLAACNSASAPAVSVRGDTFWDQRERKWMSLIDVDQRRLMDCLNAGGFSDEAGAPLGLGDTTSNGLVWHFSFQDGQAATNASGATNYGVKLTNAATLGSAASGAPPIKGLTVVTNQAAYLQGDYNVVNKKPASVIADAINVLSNAVTADLTQTSYNVARDTTINAAFVSGIDLSSPGSFNGGLPNYMRLHEDWQISRRLTYRGSFVSLGQSLHMRGPQAQARYEVPVRDFSYDTAFDDANNLPPLTPRFVYLRQLLFAREW